MYNGRVTRAESWTISQTIAATFAATVYPYPFSSKTNVSLVMLLWKVYIKNERETNYSNWKLQFYTREVKLNEHNWIPKFLSMIPKTNKLWKAPIHTLYLQLKSSSSHANQLRFTLCLPLKATNPRIFSSSVKLKWPSTQSISRQGNLAVKTDFIVERSKQWK